MRAYSDLYYYNKRCELVKLKECEICNEFLYDRQNFILLKSKSRYYICIEHDIDKINKKGVLFSFWGHDIDENSSGEIISLYRSEYRKNKITYEQIENFINNPINKKRRNAKKKIS